MTVSAPLGTKNGESSATPQTTLKYLQDVPQHSKREYHGGEKMTSRSGISTEDLACQGVISVFCIWYDCKQSHEAK